MEAATLPGQVPFAEIVAELVPILGKKRTAYIGGVKDTRVAERWMQGGTEPYRDADLRIRLAYRIAKTLSERSLSGSFRRGVLESTIGDRLR